MKILFICNEYPPSFHGGIGTVTQLLAEGLQQRGHEIYVAGIYKDVHKKIETRIQKNICVHRLKEIKSEAGDLRSIRSRIALFLFVRKIVKKEGIQLIEAPDFLGPCALWPPLGVPVIVRLHGSATYFALESQKTIPKRVFFLERSNIRKARAIISVSKYTLQKTQECFRLRLHGSVIYNPVLIIEEDINHIDRIDGKVIFVGTLMRRKGVFSLILAWTHVIEIFPHASLHLLGKDSSDYDGSSILEKLKTMLAPNILDSVHFYGHVDKDEVLRHLRKAEVAIFPSYSEACAMVAFEAIAAGCPLIFTIKSSGPEIFEDGVTAILINPDNIPEIASAICSVLSDKLLSNRLASEGRKKILRDFSLSQILDKNESFYSDVINRNSVGKTIRC
jgi:glycosyltransferase involved in cell wall biosynthesis